MIAEFTTLVGLVATYKQLRDGREASEDESFKQWLIHHKFDALSDQIANSHHLNAELNDLLRQDTSEILAKLKTIEDVVLAVSRKIEGLDGIASAFGDAESLSDQAGSILTLMDTSEQGSGVLFEHNQEYSIMLLPQGQGSIEPSENRYFHDDVEQLVGLGWLAITDHTNDGHPMLQVTRAGSRAAKQIKKG